MDELKRIALTPLLIGVHIAWVVTNTASRIQLRKTHHPLQSRKGFKIPHHVAIALIIPNSTTTTTTNSLNINNGTNTSRKGKGKEINVEDPSSSLRMEILSCITDIIHWALELGISELSLWNQQGKSCVFFFF